MKDGMENENTTVRRHDLDALRAIAMLLGIALHAALSFTVFPWAVQDTQQNGMFGLFFFAVHGFRMPLFFLLSGFFTAMLWRKRGLKSLLWHRFRRILLPLLLGGVTIIPLVNLAARYAWAPAQIASDEQPPAAETVAKDLWASAAEGDVIAVKAALEETDVNEADPMMGTNALTMAALMGQAEVVELLISEGADVNQRNRDQGTALHSAAFLGRVESVRLLLEAGADMEIVNKDGATPKLALTASWELTKAIAGFLKIPVEREELEANRKQVAELFAQTAGAPDGGAEAGPAANAATTQLRERMIFWVHQPTLAHLWFLAFLCWLVMAFAVYAISADAFGWCGLPAVMMLTPLRYLWLIPLTLVPQWFMKESGFGPDTSAGIFPKPEVLGFYAVFFFVGALYWDSDDRTGKVGRRWWLTLPFAILVILPIGLEFSMGLFGFRDDWAQPEYYAAIACCLQVTYAWLMTFGCIGLFRRWLSGESPKMRYISDSSYWLYLVHLPLVIWAQGFVREWQLPALLKFAMVCMFVTTLLLFSYRFFVRYTWIGRLLNGPRARPAPALDERHSA
jgi:peptidoglycan/LPS O-acetylase OafA/YrhL